MKRKKIKATYRNGVIEPLDRIDLPEGQELEVEFSDDNGQMDKCLSFLASQLRVLPPEKLYVNPNAKRLIEVMEKPPHLTDEDSEARKSRHIPTPHVDSARHINVTQRRSSHNIEWFC
jgi:predicted DNA-binding antitoxin AbrB/MazE fold protein